MGTQRVYCPSCRHDVELVSTPAPMQEGHANLPDAELFCVDVSAGCVSGTCPVLALSPEVIRRRLARSSAGEGRFARLHALCSGCDRETEMIVVGASYLWCTECGSTNASRLWDEMELPTDQLEN